MSETPPAPTWSLSPDQAQHLDRACNDFEGAWRAGERPQLEAYLRDAARDFRPALLRELLLLELAYRRKAGEQPAPDDYLLRLPADAGVIRGVFQRAVEAPPDGRADRPDPSNTGSWRGAPTRTGPNLPDGDRGAWPHLPGYEILSELGRGGMGVVYKARQLSAKRLVAVKMIRDSALAGPEHRERFRIEAEAAARFQHPNLVRIYDVGDCGDLPYFSMEFIEGGTLHDRLGGQAWPPRKAAEVARILANAVHYAHEKKVVHRDLKPANVLLTADGLPLIADFGLAKRLDSETALTGSQAILGTASYMAPEQAEGKTKEVGPAADVYALGAILYEMLTGRPPFVGESWQATVMQVIHDDPVPPTRLRPDVPTELESICLKCLEKEPAHRYARAGELAEDLRRFLAGESLAVVPVSEPERQARWAREAGFEIEDVLTFGVRDVVYKARQVHLNRIVALKVIAAPAQVEPAARERLVHEAKTLALLDHPNIVRIYSSGEMHGRAYLAFEYVAGGSLIERFVDQPLPPFKAARLVWQLAEALHYAHQHDVLHCALKPSNILLTADGVPKISNFGLSILLEQPESERRLAFRRLPSYTAPELADGRMADVGRATDIYSLGAILYKLLTGEPPFLGETLAETLEQVRSSPPPPPSRLQPDVPAALEAICLRCLEKEPARRYAGADELAGALDSCLTRMQTRTDEVELLPGYELLEELGRGGTGIVHKARQLSLNRLVALKIFYESRARFLVANQAVARLHHPNILDIYDSGERDGRLYVAEELIEGKTLDRQIGGKPMPPAGAARLIETLARAMHHAHEHGIIHRNLKPRVVLLTALGIPKISSFDLALLRNEPLPEQEPPGTLVGTPTYMAPEQTLGDAAQIRPATDVHALGLILYEMLIGKPAFVGADALELLHQVQTRPAPSPRLERPSLSRDLDAICLKCLAKVPRERYATAQALADDLCRFREGMPTEARPVPFGERVVYWVRRQFARAGEKA